MLLIVLRLCCTSLAYIYPSLSLAPAGTNKRTRVCLWSVLGQCCVVLRTCWHILPFISSCALSLVPRAHLGRTERRYCPSVPILIYRLSTSTGSTVEACCLPGVKSPPLGMHFVLTRSSRSAISPLCCDDCARKYGPRVASRRVDCSQRETCNYVQYQPRACCIH